MIRSGRLEEEIFNVGLVFLIYRDSKIRRSKSLLALGEDGEVIKVDLVTRFGRVATDR